MWFYRVTISVLLCKCIVLYPMDHKKNFEEYEQILFPKKSPNETCKEQKPHVKPSKSKFTKKNSITYSLQDFQSK